MFFLIKGRHDITLIRRFIYLNELGVLILGKHLMDLAELKKSTKLTLEKIDDFYKFSDYETKYNTIKDLESEGTLTPVKSSVTNGQNPPLHKRYWLKKKPFDLSKIDQIRDAFRYKYFNFDGNFYLDVKNIEAGCFDEDEADIAMLHDYITEHADRFNVQMSRNERSFDIWGKEKYLDYKKDTGHGRTVCQRLGYNLDKLHFYTTNVPLPYYTRETPNTPQTVLFLENNSPFYGMRSYLQTGKTSIFGVDIDTVVYGGGLESLSSYIDLSQSVYPDVANVENTFLYYGDLDKSGIHIYTNLAKKLAGRLTLQPFVPAYEKMIEKAERIGRPLELSKKRQYVSDPEVFYQYFDEKTQGKMKKIIADGVYIPQEILNGADF